jgi:drug/metabolite transporter (DMT)-like permease
MTGWFACALAALLLMGTQRFLYKVAAERSCDTMVTTFTFMATVTVMSALAFFAGGAGVEDVRLLLLLGLANSLAFLVATSTHIEALKRLPAATVYPLVRLDAVLVVIISLIFFDERLAGFQGIGVIVAAVAAILVARDRNRNREGITPRRGGFLFVAIAILAGTAAAVSSRFAVLHTDKTAFMTVSYGLSTLCALVTGSLHRTGAGRNLRPSLFIGVSMGLLNVVGYYAYLEALSRGPLSLVTVITGMHFVIAVIFSLIVYRERLTPACFTGIVLAMLSLILIRS